MAKKVIRKKQSANGESKEELPLSSSSNTTGKPTLKDSSKENTDQSTGEESVEQTVLEKALDQTIREDVDTTGKTEDEVNEEIWGKFVKKVNLGQILEDQLIRSARGFKKAYEAIPGNGSVEFEFKLTRKKSPNVPNLFAEVQLQLLMTRNGSLTVVQQKQIKFKHIREAREGHQWMAALYEAMLDAMLYFGFQFILLQDDARRIRPDSKS